MNTPRRDSRTALLVAVCALLAPIAAAGCNGDSAEGEDAAGTMDLSAGHADLTGAIGDLGGLPSSDGPGGVDQAMSPCVHSPFSTFGGAALRFVNPKCRFTLAEAAAGVTFDYELVVEKDIPDILAGPGDGNGCLKPDNSGLALLHTISGGGQNWCICDVGRCVPFTPMPGSITGGRWPGKIEWKGTNWGGPSDFNAPMGAPFPPGTYNVLVSASGMYTQGVQMLPFTIRDVLAITLVP